MNISAPFIARPVATTLLTIAIALAGALGYAALPVSALPQVDFPTVMVQAQLPGASPDVVATSLAAPLERHLGQIADVTEMTSQSQTGQARIVLQFALDRDINGAAQDVQAAINAAQADLPTNLLSEPTYRKVKSRRGADSHPFAHLENADARPDVRRGQQRSATAIVANLGRRADDH
jgi:multidrug efflux pump